MLADFGPPKCTFPQPPPGNTLTFQRNSQTFSEILPKNTQSTRISTVPLSFLSYMHPIHPTGHIESDYYHFESIPDPPRPRSSRIFVFSRLFFDFFHFLTPRPTQVHTTPWPDPARNPAETFAEKNEISDLGPADDFFPRIDP